mgnify:CR=1 FL=1
MMTKRKQFLVAMSGGSGSGKSTLAEALLEHLPEGQAVLFGEDAYYYPMSHYGEPGNKEEWTALVAGINYDAPRSKEADRLVKDLRALKAGETIQQPIYDYERHDRSEKTREIKSAPILILEYFNKPQWIARRFPGLGYRHIGKLHGNHVFAARDITL